MRYAPVVRVPRYTGECEPSAPHPVRDEHDGEGELADANHARPEVGDPVGLLAHQVKKPREVDESHHTGQHRQHAELLGDEEDGNGGHEVGKKPRLEVMLGNYTIIHLTFPLQQTRPYTEGERRSCRRVWRAKIYELARTQKNTHSTATQRGG